MNFTYVYDNTYLKLGYFVAKYILSVYVKRFDFLDQSSVDFINILHAAFWPKVYYTDFKCFQFGFVIFKQKGIGAKAACKMLVK